MSAKAASPYAATLSSKVSALQGAIAGKLPSVTSAMGKEVTIIYERGPTTVGSLCALTLAALPTVLPLVNYLTNLHSRLCEKEDLLERNEAALTDFLIDPSEQNCLALSNQYDKTREKIIEHTCNAHKCFFTVGNVLKTVASVALPVLVMPQIGAAYTAAAVGTALVTRILTHYCNTSQEASLAKVEEENVRRLRGALAIGGMAHVEQEMEREARRAVDHAHFFRFQTLQDRLSSANRNNFLAQLRIAELEAQLSPVPVVDEPARARTPDALPPAPFPGLQRQNRYCLNNLSASLGLTSRHYAGFFMLFTIKQMMLLIVVEDSTVQYAFCSRL